MADINVDVKLPAPINVDVTSPTQSVNANIYVPGPQGPAGPIGPSGSIGPSGVTGPQGPSGAKGNPTEINGLSGSVVNLTGVDGNIVYTNALNLIYISGNSGYFQNELNSLSSNLVTTGNTLQSNINNLSGYVNSQDSVINSNINQLSGLFTGFTGSLDTSYATDADLIATGNALNLKIDTLSGYANSTFSTKTDAETTGSLLNSKIDTLSGLSVLLTGNQTVSGIKTFNSPIIVNTISGTSSTNSLNLTAINGLHGGSINLNAGSGIVGAGSININSGPRAGMDTNAGSLFLNASSVGVNFNSNSYARTFTVYKTGVGGPLENFKVSQNSVNVDNTLTISGVPVTPSSYAASGDTVFVYGNQTISGNKTFIDSISVSGTGTFNALDLDNVNSLLLSGTNITITGNSILNIYNPVRISGNEVLTGVDLSSYALNSNLISTGQNLSNLINSLSGTLTGNYATISNLNSTGSTLTNSINSLNSAFTGFTGNLDATYATDSQLSSTGTTLINTINSLSGTLTSTYATITNLASTGSTLNTRINDLSGYVNTQDTSISNNLISTGNTLQNSINSLSGSSVLLYGDQSVGGIKTFRDNVYINNLYVTGTETIVNTAQINLASNYLLLNITGGAVDGGIFFVTGSGLTGVNDTGPIIGFDHVNKFKFGISTRNSDLSTLPDIASVQDIEAYSGVANSTFSTITNLASTGNTLEQKISSLSGTLTSTYATISNLSSTGSTLQSNINTVSSNLITTGNTLEGKISSLSGTLTSNYATITNLALTGSTLTNNLASTGSTLNSSINSLSGTLTSDYATIINLASTGSTLNSNINSLSGTLTGNYATISNLASTGSTLVGSINSLSGTLTSTYATISNLASTGSTLAANLASTGSTLQTNINNLSGYTNSTFATITNLASTGSTLTTNLINTGSTLDTKINNLSGYINSSSSNIVFTTGDQAISGNKTFNNTLSVRTISGLSGAGSVTSIDIKGMDNALLAFGSNYLGGHINLTAGSGNLAGGSLGLYAGKHGNVNYGGNIDVVASNIFIHNENTAARSIVIYKTGAIPTANVNIGQNSVAISNTFTISGVVVTPALYATSANLASTGSTLVTNLASTGSTLVDTINSLSGTLTGNYATITNLASTGSTLNTRINNLSGYINSTGSNIVFTTGDQNVAGNKTLTNKLNITANATSDSALKVGTLEFQPYSVNNAWFGDNTYYSGGFYRREAGYAGAFYFQGAEGQFRFANTDDAGTSYTPAVQLKINLDGKFGVGSNIETTTDDFTNSKFFVDSNGDVGINTVDPTEKLQVNGNIKFGDPGTASATLYMYDNPNDEYNTVIWSDSELQLTQISDSSNLTISFSQQGNVLASNNSFLKLPTGKNDFIAMDAEVVHRTGIETISGVKTFASRPTVNGTGVLLSGEAAQVDLSTTIRTTGNQTVSGVKDFQSVPLVSGREIYYQKNIVYSTGNNFTPDSNLARTFEYVLTGLAGASATLNAPINMSNGENIVIKIKQSPSGSNNMIFNAAYKFPGSVSPSLTLTPSRVDIYTILKIDSNFYSTYVKDFVN